MATTKKAARISVFSAVNWIPLCVQIEHSANADDNNRLNLSRTGKRLPNSVYFMYVNPPRPPKRARVILTWQTGKSLFIGHHRPNYLSLRVDRNGMTEILTLDPKVKEKATIKWEHKVGLGGSGGNIPVQP